MESRNPRRVIDEVLSTLSPNATFYQKRKAVSAAYPFGPRENHPYKVWLNEVKKAIGQKKKPETPGVVRVDPFEKVVRCSWCEGRECFSCLSARVILLSSVYVDWDAWQDWERRLEAFPEEEEMTRKQYADWLEENGFACVSGVVRRGERP